MPLTIKDLIMRIYQEEDHSPFDCDSPAIIAQMLFNGDLISGKDFEIIKREELVEDCEVSLIFSVKSENQAYLIKAYVNTYCVPEIDLSSKAIPINQLEKTPIVYKI